MIIGEINHKLIPHLQNCLNFEVELLTSILVLSKCYLSIFEQMQSIDKIRDKTKLLQLTKTLAFTYSNTKTY